jgi:hypothetical protein
MAIQTFQGRVRQRFSTLAVITAANPILLEGEVWIEKDASTGRSTGRRKVGDGVVSGDVITGTAFNDLPFEPTGGVGFAYSQPTASSTWVINHNLGFVPSVEVFDSGSQEIEAEVSHPSINTTSIAFTTPIAGFARLI